jgi:hypothetical protein
MKALAKLIATGLTIQATHSEAQNILFDFENAPGFSPLPINLTAGGITARFTATGQGFSIQPANSMGFTPAGFSGLCLYPNSVFASDLTIAFSQVLTAFSILYAPQELACDSSARMRVTAYLGNTQVGTATITAEPPGTWPSATLAFSSTRAFNRVVVHYDAPPPTGGDYGPIFLADNLRVTPGPPALSLSASSTNTVVLSWPASATGFVLQENTGLLVGQWIDSTNQVNQAGASQEVVVPSAEGARFYRLVHP